MRGGAEKTSTASTNSIITTALESTARIEATITEDLLRMESPPMTNWMEFFNSVRVHVLIRFGM
jgi:hypothetical protein